MEIDIKLFCIDGINKKLVRDKFLLVEEVKVVEAVSTTKKLEPSQITTLSKPS